MSIDAQICLVPAIHLLSSTTLRDCERIVVGQLEARWLQVGDLHSIERGSVRSRSARSEDIVRYVATEDPGTGERCALHLIDRAELLADFPEFGTAYRKRKNVRRLRCDPYFIYYRVKAEERVIDVMKFWHPGRLEPPF